MLMCSPVIILILAGFFNQDANALKSNSSAPSHKYVVTTYTGDRFGAGTDARVFIKLFGNKGETKEHELTSNGRDNFERGQLDTFLIEAKNVGRIRRADIRHDNSWLGPGWYLEKLTVTSEDGDYYEFPANKWLDKHLDDGKTNRELIPRPHKKSEDQEQADTDKRQPLDCSWPQGIGNGKLPDDHMTASTSFNDLHLPYHARLGKIAPNSLGGWCPYKDDKSEYLQLDLGSIKKLAGIATQGMGLVDEWTTAYRISFSNSSEANFREYSDNGMGVKSFVGNDDQNGTVLHWLKKHVPGRYFRITPMEWHGKGCLRVELYGCPAKPKFSTNEYENTDYVQLPDEQETKQKSDEGKEETKPEHHTLKGGVIEQQEPENLEFIENLKKTTKEEDTGKVRGIASLLNQNSLASTIDIIPVVHLDFDEIRDTLVPDISGHHNDAHYRKPLDILQFSKSCERGVKLNGGDIWFDGEFFIDKPRDEITIAAWIKLYSNGGQHSIFDTVGGKDSQHKEGQYHFEVDRGRLRWFHRNEAKETVFNVSTPLMVPAHIWTHCAATYTASTGMTTLYVNGKLGKQGYGNGALSQDWSGRAGIGKHKNGRILNGEIDEFYMFNKALVPGKIQLLMKRCSFETDCQLALGLQSKEIKDSQMSASTTYNLHKPYYGRINLASFWGDPARTAWCATKEDKNPYLEIELPDITSLTGVATQGLSIFDNWVTSYLFCYSEDKAQWNCYKEKGYDKIFEGNSDKNSIKRHYLHHPVDGKYVRIKPQSWYGNHLCMRAELYGCLMDLLPDPYDSFGSLPVFMEDTEAQTRGEISSKEACNNPLGVSNGEVDDLHITASTSLDEHHLPLFARLVRESIDHQDIRGCWCARDVNLRQYIEVDLGEVKTVTGIASQGYVSHDNWVASFRLGYSDETSPLDWYRENDDEKLFLGNSDRTGIVKHFLKHPIQARYVRLNPRAWHGIHICMRFELFGCKEEETSGPIENVMVLHPKAEKTAARASSKHSIPSKRPLKTGQAGTRLRTTPRHAKPTHTTVAPEDDEELTGGKTIRFMYPQPLIIRPKVMVGRPRNLSMSGGLDGNRHNTHSSPLHDRIPLKMAHQKPLWDDKKPAKLKYDQKPKEKLPKLPPTAVGKRLNKFGVACNKRSDCLPVSTQDVSSDVNDSITQEAHSEKPDMKQFYPQTKPTHTHLPTNNINQASTKKKVEIDSHSILTNFPELRKQGMTEEVITNLAQRIPDLEERIYRHFAMKKLHEPIHYNKNPEYNDLTIANLAFLKNYNEIANAQKLGVLHGLGEKTSSLLPSQEAVEQQGYTDSKPSIFERLTSLHPPLKSLNETVTLPSAKADAVPPPQEPMKQGFFNTPSLQTMTENLAYQHQSEGFQSPVEQSQQLLQHEIAHQIQQQLQKLPPQKLNELLHLPPQQQLASLIMQTQQPAAPAPLAPQMQLPQTPAVMQPVASLPSPPAQMSPLQYQNYPLFPPDQNHVQHKPMMDINSIFGKAPQALPAPPSNVAAMSTGMNMLNQISQPKTRLICRRSEGCTSEQMVTTTEDTPGIMLPEGEAPPPGPPGIDTTGHDMVDAPPITMNLASEPEKSSVTQSAPPGMIPVSSLLLPDVQPLSPPLPPPSLPAPPPPPPPPTSLPMVASPPMDPTLLQVDVPNNAANEPPQVEFTTEIDFGPNQQKLSPEKISPEGPDPRYTEYYQNYLAGIPMTPDEPTQPPVHVSDPTTLSLPSNQLETVVSASSWEVPNFNWTPFSVCSTTCGRGEKKRFRRCTLTNCPAGGVEVESVPCAEEECPEVNPYSWSPYTPCSVTCGTGKSVRYKLCHPEAAECPSDGYETEQVNCYRPSCPVCLLDFEIVQDNIVMDQSGYGNNGYLDNGPVIREHPQICGHYADMTEQGVVILPDRAFIARPRTGITIACWVNIQGEITGKHAVFTTVRMAGPNEFIGGYHFEIDDGAVRWFHRDERGKTVFSMITNPVALPRVWMHYAVTYDGYKGLAKVYVDGKERGSTEGEGLLSDDWGYKASIGQYDFDDRRINGWVDEFIIYEFALDEDQVFAMLGKMRCPVTNSTTTEIDAFKFEGFSQNKRSVIDNSIFKQNSRFLQHKKENSTQRKYISNDLKMLPLIGNKKNDDLPKSRNKKNEHNLKLLTNSSSTNIKKTDKYNSLVLVRSKDQQTKSNNFIYHNSTYIDGVGFQSSQASIKKKKRNVI